MIEILSTPLANHIPTTRLPVHRKENYMLFIVIFEDRAGFFRWLMHGREV
jgi:hypothetical protein